jgi:hypothetical protein
MLLSRYAQNKSNYLLISSIRMATIETELWISRLIRMHRLHNCTMIAKIVVTMHMENKIRDSLIGLVVPLFAS